MRSFDLDAFTPPLDVPRLSCPPVVLRPYAVSDLAMVRQASADPLIPSITSVPREYTDDAGLAFIERQHARANQGDGFSFVIAHEIEPQVGIGSIGLWLHEVESGRASIGYWLVAGARGRNLAERALTAVVSFGFAAGHPAPAPLRGTVERGLGAHGRGGRLHTGGHVARMGTHRRRPARRRLLRPPAARNGLWTAEVRRASGRAL